MKKSEVEVGQVYRVKVSGNMADVRITGENPHGGWDGVNVLTNRKVRIKSAQRLRGKAPQRPAKRSKIVSLPEHEAEAKGDAAARKKGIAKTVEAVEKGDLAKGVTVPTGKEKPGKATKGSTRGKGRDTGERRGTSAKQAAAAKPKRLGCLAAAAQILAEAGEPLNCKTMMERMLAKGLWTTGGRTPHSTLYAAVIREVAAKGDESRFRKVSRGMFEFSARRGGQPAGKV